jgi:LysR family transcriptional regulator, low CO2-responsive transcriptional regulator
VRLNAEYLIVFATVAELGNVSKAAERLNLSQPAVSGQLKALQDLVGEPLYERHSRGITLTEAGRSLLPQATAVMRSLNNAAETVLDLRGRRNRSVQCGVSWAVSAWLVPRLYDCLRQKNLTLSIQSNHSEALLEAVANASLPLAVIADPIRSIPTGLEQTHIGEEEIKLIVPSTHRLAHSGYVPIQEIVAETLLLPMSNSSVRRRAEMALQRANLRPKMVLELGGFLAIKSALLHYLGVAFLPPSMVRGEIQMGLFSAVGLEALGLTLPYSLITAPWELLNHPTREVCRCLAPEQYK